MQHKYHRLNTSSTLTLPAPAFGKIIFITKLMLALMLMFCVAKSQATEFHSVGDGNWADGATWGNTSPGVVGVDFPGAGDTAIIYNPDIVTLTADANVTRFVLKPGATLVAGANDLNVSERYIAHSIPSGTGNLNLTGAMVNCGGNGGWGAGDINITGTANWVPNSTFRVTSANINIASGGAITNSGRIYVTGSITGTDATSTFTNNTNALLSVTGSLLTNGTLVTSASGNRVIYETGTTTIKIPTPATYQKLNLYGSTTKTVSADLTIANDLIVTGTTNIDIGANVLELGGRTYWYTSNANPIVPGDGTLNMTASTTQSLPGSYELNGLVVNNSAGVNFTGSVMLIKDSLLVTSGNFSTNNRVTLVSNASGTARVGELTGSITGNVTVQRFVDGADAWHVVAMPITNGALEDWSDDTPMTGFPGSQFPNFGWTSVYYYDETVLGVRDSGFVAPTALTNTVPSGEGIWMYFSPVTLDVTGTLASGSIAVPVTYTPDSGFDHDGWNLVGNPFASPIRWADFTSSSLEDQYWIYDPATGNFANWNEATQTGTLGANGIIPSMQAFEVHATAAGPSLTIPQSSKARTAPAFKSNPTNTLSIQLYTKGSKLCDELLVQDMPITYNSYDHGVDVLKRFPPVNPRPALSSISEEGYELAVNALDFSDPTSEVLIRMHHMEAGTYKLGGWEKYDGLKNLWLEDLVTGQVYRLAASTEVTFEAIPGREDARFKLFFGNKEVAESEITEPEWHVYIDQSNVTLNITEGIQEPSLVEALTLDGKLIASVELQEGIQRVNIPLPGNLAQGSIILRWMTGNGETVRSEVMLNRLNK